MMTDLYSTMVPYDFIKCSREDFDGLQHVLAVERQRLKSKKVIALSLRSNTLMESYLFMLKILVMIVCLKMCVLQ